ncbi:MAG: protein kinase [Verrucomicrobiaceae bacterium]|nr:protein kinase [Verrucomicrobiaceae bacterium]
MICPECHAELPANAVAGLCPRCVARSLEEHFSLPPVQEANRGERPVLPGWDVLEPVGAGGQGIVWRAVRLEDDALGAVKVFRTQEVESAVRMESEAAALRSLEHPGIVRVLDCGETEDERFYVITEFVEGCDLQRLMQAQRLTTDRALEIVTRVTEAVAHAHERGLVHRDLKPANVLIGRDGAVKLADFSLARDLDAAKKITMTREGITFGTPYYLAPEVMRGEPATVSVDLYALGVMLYEMLTGAPPAGRFARVSEKGDLPREVDRLIESLLAEEPSKRPASAESVLKSLAQIDALRRGELAARLRKHRWKLIGGIAASVMLAGLIGYLIPRPLPPVPPPPRLNAKGFANPAAATRAEPWKNSLEMSFIPVPGLGGLLVCQHETRVQDFLASLMSSELERQEWLEAFGGENAIRSRLKDVRPSGWEPVESRAGGLQEALNLLKLGPKAAASGINHAMAQRFCAWLTWREQREGRLQVGEYYRLPTDDEWSLAAGLAPETEPLVEKRHLARKGTAHPWGEIWPPPADFANYAGTEARDENWPETWLSLPGSQDAFPRTAPVGSFPASETGLFDVWGNVWEWCDSSPNVISVEKTLRGGSWVDGGYPGQLRVDFRRFERPNLRESCIGFRCVLVVPELPAAKKSAAD